MKLLYTTIISFFALNIYAQPSNNFTTSADGWTAICEGVCMDPTSSWLSLNGNPGGCFVSTDNASGTWYFYSSPDFNIDLSSYYGAYLNFDLKQNTSAGQTNDIDLMLMKPDGSKIVYNTAFNPGTTWTTYCVSLTEIGWKYNTLGGAAVTTIDFQSFLSSGSGFRIRGDYSTLTTETAWLDNVNITGVILLPIELSAFSAQQAEGNISQINWETESELDLAYFQIEKSTNGGMSFDSIGYIAGEGNSTVFKKYSFTDDNFISDAYYRLKSVDADHSSTYSDIIYLKNEFQRSSLSLYPNPAFNNIIVENLTGLIPYTSLRITDCYSKVLYERTLTSEQISSAIQLDVNDFTNGTYFLSLISDKESNTIVFQVLR